MQPFHHFFHRHQYGSRLPTPLLVWGLLLAWLRILPILTQTPTLLILLWPIPTWSLSCPLYHVMSLFLSQICLQDIATFWMCSKSKMQTSYRHIACMIAQSNSKMVHIQYLSPSMGYLNPNLRLFAHIWMKTSLRASFNPPNHWLGPQSYLSRRRMVHYDYVWIIGVSTKLRCVIVIPCP